MEVHNIYSAPKLLIAGEWRDGRGIAGTAVINPSTENVLDELGQASLEDLDAALIGASKGFEVWQKTSALERQRCLQRGIDLIRQRSDEIATTLTLEQGKPLVQSKNEIAIAADMIQWYAEQARRSYGRIVPAPTDGADYEVRKQPVGPCLLLSPWNMPVILAARKIGGALAAGCSAILKPPSETPGAVAMVVSCLVEGGLPPGALNLVFGDAATVTSHLMKSDVIRKISFTGSVAVGKHLAGQAAAGLKRLTLELGGHSPVIIFDDADLDKFIPALVQAKFRNAGQLCHAPTRFFIQRSVYPRFVDRFAEEAAKLKVGPGLEATTQMGPLANHRRLESIAELVEDTRNFASLVTGGTQPGDKGYFFAPTVFADVEDGARAMRDEPFGPIALMRMFDEPEEAIRLANSTRFGLGSYVFTDSARLQRRAIAELEVGAVAVNSTVVTVAEAPFGGTRDSGYGYESGEEGLDGYLHTKFVNRCYI